MPGWNWQKKQVKAKQHPEAGLLTNMFKKQVFLSIRLYD